MKRSNINRRKFLQNATLTAGALAATAVPGSAMSKKKIIQEDREIYHRILEKRDKNNWTQERFHDVLRDKGAKVQGSQSEIIVSGKHGQNIEETARGENGFSTQNVPEDDMRYRFDLSLIAFRTEDFGTFKWGWDTEGLFEFGVSPWDLPSVAWRSDDYSFNGGGFGNNMYLWKRDGDSGALVRYDDKVMNSGEQGSDSFTVYLARETSGTRRLYSAYRHTWNSVEVDSVTFSYGSVEVTFSTAKKVWKHFLNTEIS